MRNARHFLWIAALLVACSDPYPGFHKISPQLYTQLIAFGEDGLTLDEADFSLMRITCKQPGTTEAAGEFDMYIGELKARTDTGNAIDSSLLRQLMPLRTGDKKAFIVPYHFFQTTFLDAFQANFFRPDAMVELTVQVTRTFGRNAFATYVMNSAQHGEMSEREAIDLLFLNDARPYKWHGQIAMVHEKVARGDTVKAGREVTITYNTFLLNGEQLDSTTSMTFTFGKPGQLIPGLQYALSLMHSGESAQVFMPSAFAFGEDGSSTGIVPRNTPIYFHVKVDSVHFSPPTALARR
jgi:hypothetical protein